MDLICLNGFGTCKVFYFEDITISEENYVTVNCFCVSNDCQDSDYHEDYLIVDFFVNVLDFF